MVGVGLGLTLGKPPKGEDYYAIVSLIGFPLIFRFMIMNAFNTALKYNEKRVIHGVITCKEVTGKSSLIEFSGRLKIKMAASDYKILKLGDIVRMEMLTEDKVVKRKVAVEGSI